jgi:predicted O-methyltransferase YrrM
MSDEGRIGPVGPESRFSGSDWMVPHPEHWTSTDDHSTEIEVSDMLAGMVRGLQPEYVIETGSAWGQTAEAIGAALLKNGHGHLHSIELDPERVEYSRKRLATSLHVSLTAGKPRGFTPLPVTVHQMSSMDFTPTEEVQFAFFDSLFPLRVPEFLRYYPYMKKGSIVAFHDCHPGHGGGQFKDYHMDLRTTIITELEQKWMLKVLYFQTPRGIMVGEVI